MDDDQNEDQIKLRLRLVQIEIEFEDLKCAIDAMVSVGEDPLRIHRFKKKKLVLKDEITKLNDEIIPDIIA